jgi:hypothetical protein
MCQLAKAISIDTGTLCRSASPTPGPAGRQASASAVVIPAVSQPKLLIDVGVLQPTLISAYTRQLLKSVIGQIGLDMAYVTSGIRPPERQAKTMYENIISKGVTSQLKLYAQAGKQIVQIYSERLDAGDDKDAIIDAMTEKIYELLASGRRVSKHCVSEQAYEALNVIDISYSRMPTTKRIPFEQAILRLQGSGKIARFISPRMKNGEPAYHMEIPQP